MTAAAGVAAEPALNENEQLTLDGLEAKTGVERQSSISTCRWA